MYRYTYIHTYIHTYTHIYVRMYIHTCMHNGNKIVHTLLSEAILRTAGVIKDFAAFLFWSSDVILLTTVLSGEISAKNIRSYN